MNEKELVYRVLIKKADGSFIKDFDIFKDGTWREIYVPKDRETIEFFKKREESYFYLLEIFREELDSGRHVFRYLPKNNDDWNAYITLCALRGEPKSLTPDEYDKDEVVQYFGEGDPWEESELWNDIKNGEYVI